MTKWTKYFANLSVVFAKIVVRGRWAWLLSIILLSGYLAFQLPHLIIDGSIERIMLKNDPEKVHHEHSVKLFGGDDLISIVLPYPEGVWHPERLTEVQQLTQRLEAIEGVDDIFSLTNYTFVDGQLGTLTTANVMQRLSSGETIDDLKSLATNDPAVRNNLVSLDGTNTSINLRLRSGRGAPIGFHNDIVRLVRDQLRENLAGRTYYVAGWPVVKADLTSFMERDLVVLLPLVALVVTMLMVLSFRRLSGVLLPFTAIALSLIWTVGGMTLTGHALTIVSNSLPVIIIAIGATYCIYVATHLFRAIDEGHERLKAIELAVTETIPGVLLSGFTTVVGFAALKLNPLDVIDEFGTVAIWGSLASMVMGLVFMPSLAAVLPIRRKPLQPEVASARWGRLVALTLRHRRLVLVGTSFVLLICGFLLTRVQVETAPVSWFPRDADVRKSVEYTTEHLTGITPYNVVLETDVEGAFNQPELLQRVSDLQKWLEQQSEIDATLSVVDTTRVVFRALGGDESWYRIPDDSAGVEQVMMLSRSENLAGLHSLVSDDGRVANVLIRSSVISSEQGVKFAERVNQYLNENFKDLHRATITGNAYLTYRTNLQFTNGFISSLLFGIVVIGVLMVFVLRSWKLGAMSLVANLIPIAVNYAILGIGDLTLNAATSITGCIALGNAVDSTIHFLLTYRKQLANKETQEVALRKTLELEGWPIVTSSLALSIGFSVLMFSNFMPVISLGLLVGVTMLVCMTCNLVLLPVLLTASCPAWMMRIASMKIGFFRRLTAKVAVNCVTYRQSR